MTQMNFTEQLKNALSDAFMWERHQPSKHLEEYSLITISVGEDIPLQILSLQENYNYGFVLHSFISPNHPVWLSPIGMMFGKGNCFEENGEQTLICPPDPQYITNLVEKIILSVYGKTENVKVQYT